MPCCVTVEEFLAYVRTHHPLRKRAVADAWACLQIWFCKHPQNSRWN